jgi:carboxymethylenebutenolidase
MQRKTASQFDQELLDLYDDYVHNRIGRRDFLDRAAKFAVGSTTALALLESLSPQYALANQIPPDDPRIVARTLAYDSPVGGGNMSGYLVHPAEAAQKLPAVLVIHENRGLNPYIQDVTRRLGVAGFLAFAPDALAPLGGYPGNDDQGRALQQKRDPDKMTEDFIAAAQLLNTHDRSNGKVGVVGFCFGGGMANTLAVRIPEVITAAVPFYGRQPATSDVAKIKAPLLLHYAQLDQRINDGWPAFEQALQAAKKKYTVHFYPQVNHGFHNDTTPRYDEQAARLAWQRTLDFFTAHLR